MNNKTKTAYCDICMKNVEIPFDQTPTWVGIHSHGAVRVEVYDDFPCPICSSKNSIEIEDPIW